MKTKKNKTNKVAKPKNAAKMSAGKKFDTTFKNWPIKKKLMFSHISIIASAFIVIVLLLLGMNAIKSTIVKLYEGPTTNAFYVGDIRWSIVETQRTVNWLIAQGEANLDTNLPTMETELAAAGDLMTETIAKLKETVISDESRKALDALDFSMTESLKHQDRVLTLLKSGEFAAANTYNEQMYKPYVDIVRDMANTLRDSIYEAGEDYKNSAITTAYILMAIGFVLLICVVIFALVLVKKVTKAIVPPIKQVEEASKRLFEGDMSASKDLTYQSNDEVGVLAEALRGSMDALDGWVQEISGTLSEIANGDLTKKPEDITDFKGDFVTIKESFVLILQNLNEALSMIAQSAHEVDIGSDEIAKSATDLAEGTTEQAGAVEELTATVSTVAAAAEDSAKQTGEAYDMIMKSVQNAEADMKQVHLLQEEMQKIKDISEEVQSIIGTIEDIASQTSLLSLNASIEAARAGEAGRGFAVVADQIGKLAQDSAQAAVSTRNLIGATVEEVDNGNAITKTTVEAFEKIIKDLNAFADVTETVRAGSLGAAEAMKEVESGIDQISEVTQQNAAASEESSAVSEELAAKAEELASQVRRFKLNDEDIF